MLKIISFFAVLISCCDVFASTDTSFEEFFRTHKLVSLLINPDNGAIVDANDAAVDFYGYSAQHIRQMAIQDINMLSPEQVAIERLEAKSENRNYFIFRHRLANDSIKTVQVFSSPIIVDGKKLLFSIIRDISSEREIQQQLWHYQSNLETLVDKQVSILKKQSKQQSIYQFLAIIALAAFSIFLIFLLKRKNIIERQIKTLSRIVQQSPVAIATLDKHGHITYSNAEFEARQRSKDLLNTNKNKSFIDPYQAHNQNLERLKDKMHQGEDWLGELRSVNKQGHEYWDMTNVFPLTDAADNAKHVVISQDITRLKEHEKQLRLASTVFHTATEAVMVCDIDNKILATNKAFTKITGYTEAEVLGRDPSILQSGHHDRTFYQHMFEQLESTGSWQGEISNRRKNGEIYYEWLSITALTSPTGQLEAYVSLFNDITKRKRVEDKIYHQANFDGLTGLANRNLFSDRLKHSLSQAQRQSSQLALMFIDLDGFKQINDNFGHSQGDLLLQNVSQRLTDSIRSSDMIARLGGDEFAVIITKEKDIEAVDVIANKIIREISKPFMLNNKEGYVTASIGIVIFPEDGDDVEELLTKADSAMYKAKANGRNNFQFFTKEMDVDAQQKRELTTELRAAMKHGQFEVWFQPIHDCKTHHLTYSEALVRWNHPERGIVSPQSFIPIAEDIGLINSLGYFVLRQACDQAAKWQILTEDAPGVAVNVSSIQFQQDDFAAQVAKVLFDTQLPPEKLILEITESLLIADDQKVYEHLNTLKNLGISISLDDFGTGYSSLSYLKRFPVNKLKIDQSFVRGIGEDHTDTQLISAILSMAKSLQMVVVAEGVETEFQLEQIKALDCDLVQGYVFSKPLPADSFDDYLKQHIQH